ncbi:MAG: CHAT domain-containing protein [Anaerotignaceae bacterium]
MKRFVALVLSASMILGLSANAFAEENLLRYCNTGYVYYCVGKGITGSEKIDTTQEAETVANYISKWGYDSNLFENARQSDFNDGRLNSPVTYYAGHGSVTSVDTGASGISTGNQNGFYSIKNLDLSTAELVFLAACYTADNSDSSAPLPISRYMANLGVSGQICTIGWHGKPDTVHMITFSEAFFEALDNGDSYSEAARHAKKETKKITGGQTSGGIYTYELFGAVNNTITEIGNSLKRTAKKSVLEMSIDDTLPQYIVDGDVYYYEFSKDYNEIEQCIKENFNPNFDIDDFQVTEEGAEGENAENSLSLRYVVDGFVSDFGYELLVEKNRVLLFTQLGTDIIDNVPVIDKDNMLSDEELCKMAVADDDDSVVVAEQEVNRYVDSATGKIKYIVNTVYGEEGGCYCAVGFEYLQ